MGGHSLWWRPDGSRFREFINYYDHTDSLIVTSPKLNFLHNLVKIFPSMASRPLLLTGESYAGTYIVSSLVQIRFDFASANDGSIAIYLESPLFHPWATGKSFQNRYRKRSNWFCVRDRDTSRGKHISVYVPALYLMSISFLAESHRNLPTTDQLWCRGLSVFQNAVSAVVLGLFQHEFGLLLIFTCVGPICVDSISI